MCVGLEEAITAENHSEVGEANLVCCLQLHHTSPSIPVNAPRGHPSSISIVHTCDHDLRACQRENPSVTYYLWRCPTPFSLRLHSIPAVKVQDPAMWCIYQSHCGNSHSGGHELASWLSGLRWRRLNTNQRSDLPWSFIKRCPL